MSGPGSIAHAAWVPIVEVTQIFRFSAAHRMHNPRLSAEPRIGGSTDDATTSAGTATRTAWR